MEQAADILCEHCHQAKRGTCGAVCAALADLQLGKLECVAQTLCF